MGAITYVLPRRRVIIVAVLVLVLALASLFALERTNTGASTVSHISSIPASAHHRSATNNKSDDNHGKGDDNHGKGDDENHRKPPKRCDDDRKDRERNKNCRPPSGKPRDE
jgi:hypothetical protein